MANQIRAAMRSGMGRVRANNEDAYYFSGRYPSLEDINKEAAMQGAFSLQGSLFGVSDGIGGAYSGEVASTTTVAWMENLKELLKTKHFSEAIASWTRDVNREVSQAVPGGGCTVALVFAGNQALYIAHIGDSRVYRLHGGELIPMTRDHSKVQMLLDAGMITKQEAAAHPQRHMVVRYIGMDEEENGVCAAAVARPMPLVNGDRYLICTDGVTDMLNNEALADLLKRESGADACAQAIYSRALAAGGLDNTTLIVLDIEVEDSSADKRQAEGAAEDEYETTLGRGNTLPLPESKAEAPRGMSVTQTYQVPSLPGKKLVIRSEISIQP